MSGNFGEIVRQARVQLGWDQAELAQRLGSVRQQAVSRWEKGTSRPRRAMVAQLADLLGLDVNELLLAAGYPGATADRHAEVGLPVRPLLEKLPLDELSPDDFEQFSTDLARLLHPRASAVSRNGAQGSRQDGVDVIIRYRGMKPDGIQCKREKQFGAKKIQKAVGELRMEVGRCCIYLSRVATADARKEIAKHSAWELMDVKDLSSAVRTLKDRDAALRLVDTYFPGYREPFLGVRAPGPWLTCDEFFRPASGERIYTHRWQMVGRSKQLTGLMAFAEGSDAHLAVLTGRGGIGKSRLLRELALASEREGQARFRFAARNADISPADFDQLPPGEGLVVVVDDVPEGAEVISLIDGVQRARPDARILVSLRPQQLPALTASLGQAGVHPSELARWDLGDLSYADAEALASEALGPDAVLAVARRLAVVGLDCPLLIVVGAGLIRRGVLDPARLESGDPLRSEIMAAFRRALTGDPAEGSPETRNEVLKGIAVLQPFRIDQPAFRSALERLAGRAFDQLMPHLRHLEEAGVLTRRGTAIRIIPDLLGDTVLAEACLDLWSGASTGYLDRVLSAARGECLLNAFVNASRVDWQFKDTNGRLTASLWEMVTSEFKAGGNDVRLGLLAVLRKVAYFQPGQTIALARWTIAHPADDSDEKAGQWHYQPTHRMVLEELSAPLKNAAYHADHLREAADLLWLLARYDSRPLNRYPEHPVRILQGLAGYSPGKPLDFYEALIAAAQEWLRDPEVAEWPYSPFEVLSPMLATEIMDHIPDAMALRIRAYAVNAEAVRPVRGRVLELALVEARNPDPKRAADAVKAIESSLRYPAGMFGRSVSPDERGAWTPLFIETISRLGELAADATVDPAVIVAIRAALWWHAEYSETATRPAARDVWAFLPETAPHNLALVLHDGWGRFLPRGGNVAETESLRERKLREVADQAIAAWSDEELVDRMEERLAVDRLVFGGRGGDAGPFTWTLADARPPAATEICRRVAEHPESVLRDVVRNALSRLATFSADVALQQARDLLATQDTAIACHVAEAYGLSMGARDTILEEEADLLRSLAAQDDPQVRRFTVIAAQRIARRHHALATELAMSVRFGDSAGVAEEVAAVFGQHGFLSWADLAPDLASDLLDQLRECPSIDGYQVGILLAEITATDADKLLTLLMERVELTESRPGGLDGYDPIPRTWHVPLPFRSDARYAGYLRTVLEWMSASSTSSGLRQLGAEIFAAVAGDFDGQVTAVLLESAESGQKAQVIAVAAVLRHAPAALVWNTDFVTRTLQAAARHDEECLQAIGTGLQAAVVNASMAGRPAAPDGQERAGRAAAIAASMPAGSLEQRFYQSMEGTRAKLADMWRSADEGLADHRDW